MRYSGFDQRKDGKIEKEKQKFTSIQNEDKSLFFL